jgi:SAM-dependent methyltransferase
LFVLPEIQAMLREELGLLPAHAARQPAGRALLLQPDAAVRSLPVDARHLATTRLHADGHALGGDVVCDADALPLEDESFQLVFAQHIGDVLPADSGIVEELARVMAPGSLLLWSGFNPWSPWLAWMHWRARGSAPQTLNVDTLRRRLQRFRLAPVALDYLGTCWPHRAAQEDGDRNARRSALLAPLRGTYLLAARKQRAVLTPLRPRVARNNVALGSQLAGTPSQRACA